MLGTQKESLIILEAYPQSKKFTNLIKILRSRKKGNKRCICYIDSIDGQAGTTFSCY
jgi:hypothetical protein